MRRSWSRHVIILMLALGGCSTSQSEPSTPADVTEATIEPIVSATPFVESILETTTSTPPLVVDEPTPDPSAFLFNTFHMETESVGWGTADIPDAQGTWYTRILHTADGGHNWLDVSPANGLEIKDTFFLDGENAWVITTNPDLVSSEGRPTVLLWQTRDGGQTWNKGEPLTERGMALGWEVFFVDMQHGWLIGGNDVAMGTSAVTLYKTEDSGIHWAEIFSTFLDKEPPPGAFPLGCYKSFLWFRDPSTGWVMGGCWADNSVLLLNTSDGGLTWQSQELPAPAEPASGPSCSPYPPTFFSPQEGILQIICTTTDLLIYHTHDGGQTWDIPAHRPRMMVTTLVDFVDANHGWHFAVEDSPTNTEGRAFYVTHDGGKTWSEIDPVFDIGDSSDLPYNKLEAVGDFNFIDLNTGWATLNGYYDYSLILKTTDGGLTWTHWVPYWQAQ
jgi:photosystem II stability/assembly factor-like uncharacterized protein